MRSILDGTLADLDSALERIAEELFPNGVSAEEKGETEALTAEEEQLEPARVRALTRRQQRDIWAEARRTTDFWETLDETEPGIVARIAAVAAARGWEVIFVTQRPEAAGETTQRQSQRWLQAHGFDMPSVFVLPASASRGRVAAALSLDAVVDDRTEGSLDVKLESQARSFLVSRAADPEVTANARRLGIEAVPSVGACLDLLDAAPQGGAGILRRLKRLISS